MNQRKKSKRRRWLQFSLRTLFVVTTIAAVWLGMVMHKARKLRRSVDAITAAGGAVYFHHQMDDADAPPPGPAWLRRLVGDEPFITPFYVELRGPDVTDEFIAEHLRSMTSLEEVDIESPNVTDAALAHLRSMRHLHRLYLDCPRLTDAALEHVASLRELYRLSLNCPRLTDAALPHIATLPKLGGLVLNSPHLTASGLQQLEGMDHLEVVTTYRDLENRRVVRFLLHLPADVEFDEAPLIDVLEYLVDLHGSDCPIDLDDVPEAKRHVPTTIETMAPLGAILDAILEPCELGYYYEKGTVRIASREIARDRRQGAEVLRSILPSDGRIEIDW
jgi:hypothetical protein